MRTIVLVLAVAGILCAAASSHVEAQSTLPTDVTAAAIKLAIERAKELQEDRLIDLADMGKYSVGVGVVVRKPGTFQRFVSHDNITEIYYVLRGSGTQLTGTLVNGSRGGRPGVANETVNPVTGPGLSSTDPLQNSRSRDLHPGDVQIIPPGVGHGLTMIGSEGLEYLVFRVDPEHVMKIK